MWTMNTMVKTSLGMLLITGAIVGAFFLGRASIVTPDVETRPHTGDLRSDIRLDAIRDMVSLRSMIQQFPANTQEVKDRLDLRIDIRIAEEFFAPLFAVGHGGINELKTPESQAWLPLLGKVADFRDEYGWRVGEDQEFKEFL